jgi:uncharacterized radical SAM superfamily Fe-S cluster-containing enzyme
MDQGIINVLEHLQRCSVQYVTPDSKIYCETGVVATAQYCFG